MLLLLVARGAGGAGSSVAYSLTTGEAYSYTLLANAAYHQAKQAYILLLVVVVIAGGKSCLASCLLTNQANKPLARKHNETTKKKQRARQLASFANQVANASKFAQSRTREARTRKGRESSEP